MQNFSVLTAVGAAIAAREEEKNPVPLPGGRAVNWTLTNRLEWRRRNALVNKCFISFGSAKKPAKKMAANST
jgi:hypothetical protein